MIVDPLPEAVPDKVKPETKTSKWQGWKSVVNAYQNSCSKRASWQLVNTLAPYLALWIVMYFTVQISWWLTIPLAILAGGFLVRVFIIFHDCGHGSFFKSKRANDFWGVLTGLLSLTPYHHWKWVHSVHHATNGHLDRRGMGDIWTMTVDEYLEAPRTRQICYRLARNPIVMFVLGPLFVFLIEHRFADSSAKPDVKLGVYLTNLGLFVGAIGLTFLFGFLPWVILQLIVISVAGAAGIWLFYVQHQYEDAYWESGSDWDYLDAAMKGSSYYKLPRILQWFSGNIGFHHIHHLSPRIPNYHLERCHNSEPMFSEVRHLTLWESFKSANLRLWDAESKKLISFRQLRKKLRKERKAEKMAAQSRGALAGSNAHFSS